MTELVTNILNKMDKDKKSKISGQNIKTIRRFDEYNVLKGLKESTRKLQIYMILEFSREAGKNFKDITSEDIRQFLSRKKVKPYTLENWKNILRKFFKYASGGKEYPETVSWIEPSRNCYEFKKPNEMLTEEEVKTLIDSALTLQHKTIIAVLWDTAIRNSELVSMDIGSVVNNGEHISITVTGKTGTRTLGLISSAPLVSRWLDEHPFKHDRNKPLWLSYTHQHYLERITIFGVGEIISQARKRAGIQKRTTAHTYRHSKLTNLAKKGMTESEMRKFAGWTAHSNMPEIYIHLTQEDVDRKRWELETGQKPKEKHRSSILIPVMCPRCGKQNASTNKYCSKCWLPLSREALDRDIRILNLFKSGYARLKGIHVDKMLSEFWSFKTQTEQMCQMYCCFNGSKRVNIDNLKRKFGDASRFSKVMDYCIQAELIRVDGEDAVLSDDRSVFNNFLLFQKLYLEPYVSDEDMEKKAKMIKTDVSGL